MIRLAALTLEPSDLTVLTLVVTVVGCFALWRFAHWLLDGPAPAEPWDEEVATAIAQDEATPVCCRCLQPQEPSANFCPKCGAPVGTYTNLLPFPYLFSLGDLLRIGTNGVFNRTPVTIVGFVLLGLAEYTVLAPFYWFMFLRNLKGQHPAQAASEELPPAQR
jgi:hypothetical protein